MPRVVTLALYASDGRSIGLLPPVEVAAPWWHHTGDVVAAVRDAYGVDVRVLRLLGGTAGESADGSATYGGSVTYAAELVGTPAGLPVTPDAASADAADEPLRAIWARPGGVDRILARVDPLVAAAGRPRTGPARQERSWNLSCVLEAPTTGGPVWIKSVPPFFGHEARVLAWVGDLVPALVPRLVAADPKTRTLVLDDVPGDDGYAAGEPTVGRMIDLLVDLQARTAGRVADLAALGVPDWRAGALGPALVSLLDRPDVAATVDRSERNALAALVDDLPRRFAALAGCGIPETLVHGDCHPGNWRVDGSTLTLLDWGDAGIGHPLLDTAAGTVFVTDPAARDHRLARYASAWSRHLPGADPARAVALVRPVAALRQALIYRGFLDGIEPAERAYHEGDVGWWLRRALGEATAAA